MQSQKTNCGTIMTQNGILMNDLLDKNVNPSNECACTDISDFNAVQTTQGFEIKLDEIHIWHGLPGRSHSRRFDFHQDSDFVQMIFSIDSLSQTEDDELGPEQNILLYVAKGDKDVASESLKVGTNHELFGINISSDLFFKVLPANGAVFNTLRDKINNKQSILINSTDRPVTIPMREVIHQIMRCLRKDHCRCIYYQAKVIELLSLQLEQVESAGKKTSKQKRGLKEDELKRIYQVRDLLHQNPEESFSLLGLAHAVGTNDSTLKKHFKLVFGTTVFSYLNSYRMERAKEMLLNQDCKIAAIAHQFGYKHATHFSAAFKKYYGYPPTKIKA